MNDYTVTKQTIISETFEINSETQESAINFLLKDNVDDEPQMTTTTIHVTASEN